MILYWVVNAPTARYRLASKNNKFFLNFSNYIIRILNTCLMNAEYLPVSRLCENESLSRSYFAISSHFCCIADITKLTVGLDGYANFSYFLFLPGVPKISVPQMILYWVVNAPTARYRLASKKNYFFQYLSDEDRISAS